MAIKRKQTRFAVTVKKRLIDMGMSQRELCRTLGISATYMQDILTGRRWPAELVRGICRELSLPESMSDDMYRGA